MPQQRKKSTGPGHNVSTPAQMKFRTPGGEATRSTAKGTKPLPDPVGIGETLTKVLVFGCSKVLFVPIKYRLMGYAACLFFISLVADYVPFPKTYFSDSSNVPNQYFVKFSWAWTFVLVGIFISLTAPIYCAGERRAVLRHFSRIVVGTFVWWVWTSAFRYVEDSTGVCRTAEGPLYSVKTKRTCGSKSGRWEGFDVSGHAFLLIWCVLFIIEESKAILGWDNIKNFIRNEDYNRNRVGNPSTSDSSVGLFPETPLCRLSVEQFEQVKKLYKKFSLLASMQFVLLTLLVVLWDVMIIATSVYFHSMIEKVIGGLIASMTWFVLYQGFYTWDIFLSPGLPGQGEFRNDRIVKSSMAKSGTTTLPNLAASSVPKTSASANVGPQFMGMPLYPLGKQTKDDEGQNLL